MTDIFTFSSKTPRLGLPNLFAAQAQKEFTVNEAFALLDALLHASIEGTANEPPALPVDGECWIVGGAPVEEWTGHAGKIACRQSGNWLFVTPVEGMTVFDKTEQRIIRYDGDWPVVSPVSLPAGGEMVDAEARTAISGILEALKAAAILPAS